MSGLIIKNNTPQFIELTKCNDEFECENCIIRNIDCAGSKEYCSLSGTDQIYSAVSNGHIERIKIVLRKALKEIFLNNIEDDEYIKGRILQKSFMYSSIIIRAYDLRNSQLLNVNIPTIENELKKDLFEIVKELPKGSILTVRTYAKGNVTKSTKVDFTISNTYNI